MSKLRSPLGRHKRAGDRVSPIPNPMSAVGNEAGAVGLVVSGSRRKATVGAGALPSDDVALDTVHVVTVLLALLSGAAPAEALDESN